MKKSFEKKLFLRFHRDSHKKAALAADFHTKEWLSLLFTETSLEISIMKPGS